MRILPSLRRGKGECAIRNPPVKEWAGGAVSMTGTGKSENEAAQGGAGGAVGNVDEVSPKQPGSKARRDWYPYYAGFTKRFVEAVIDQYFRKVERVLDPWSGSGTTTVTCLRRGLRSHGIDINPAVTVVARARLNAVSTRARLLKCNRSGMPVCHTRSGPLQRRTGR